jgi:RNA polymerase sigma-70 factor (ECF subfamily)
MTRAIRACTLLVNLAVKDVKCGVGLPVPSARRAFARAVRDHKSLLAALARRLCDNDADAEDLVHDTFERALRAWDRNRDHADLRSWIVSILNHLFIDRCRKARRRPRHETLDGLELSTPEPPPPPVWARISEQQIEAALASLDPELRDAYELRMRGYSYERIAAELRIPKATVGTRLFRARRRLKAALQRQKAPATTTP